MASETSIAERLRHAYQVWNDTKAANPEEFLKLCADRLSFGSVADVVQGELSEKQYRSKDELREYLEALPTIWDMIHFTMRDYIVDGDRIVVRGSCAWRNKETDIEVDTAKVDFWRFENGLCVEFHEYYDTAKVMAALPKR